mgnify:CR=1 FL=1
MDNPVKPMNAKDKIPNSMKAIAFPDNPFGRLAYFASFCLMPASYIIASIQPSDEPKEKAAVSTNEYSLLTENNNTAKTTQLTVINGK